MNKEDAKQIIDEQVQKYRSMPYQDLIKMIDAEPITYELMRKNGIMYQVEIQAFWDDKQNGNIRVSVSIDNGGIRAFRPLTSDFIKSHSNNFIGE